MRWLVLVVVVGTACKKVEPQEVPPESAKPHPQVVTDPKIAQQVDEGLAAPAEPVSAKAQAAAKDPAPVLGEWTIRSIGGTIDDKVSPPEPPIMPGSWVFAAGGTWKKLGGNELEGTYVFTGDRLYVSALGPAIEYEIVKLTKTELVVISRIQGTQISNETRFDHKK